MDSPILPLHRITTSLQAREIFLSMNRNYNTLESDHNQRYDVMDDPSGESLLDELSNPALYARTCRRF